MTKKAYILKIQRAIKEHVAKSRFKDLCLAKQRAIKNAYNQIAIKKAKANAAAAKYARKERRRKKRQQKKKLVSKKNKITKSMKALDEQGYSNENKMRGAEDIEKAKRHIAAMGMDRFEKKELTKERRNDTSKKVAIYNGLKNKNEKQKTTKSSKNEEGIVPHAADLFRVSEEAKVNFESSSKAKWSEFRSSANSDSGHKNTPSIIASSATIINAVVRGFIQRENRLNKKKYSQQKPTEKSLAENCEQHNDKITVGTNLSVMDETSSNVELSSSMEISEMEKHDEHCSEARTRFAKAATIINTAARGYLQRLNWIERKTFLQKMLPIRKQLWERAIATMQIFCLTRIKDAHRIAYHGSDNFANVFDLDEQHNCLRELQKHIKMAVHDGMPLKDDTIIHSKAVVFFFLRFI